MLKTGWKLKGGTVSKSKKNVLIHAPHRTGFEEFVNMFKFVFSAGRKIFWMGKKEMFYLPWSLPFEWAEKKFHTRNLDLIWERKLFYFPCGPLFKWLGGIPVDRKNPGDIIDQMVALFKTRDEFVLVIEPEGTRKKVTRWKTGFYRIAQKAKVPIVLGFHDYEKRIAGAIDEFVPTGDIEADMEKIKEFYVDIKGSDYKRK